MREYQNMNSFSRTVANEQKKGAYYTDKGMCKRIGRLFALPADDEVSVLEPAVGDATAVLTFLDNVTVSEAEQALGVAIVPVGDEPEDLIEALLG